MFQAFNLKQCCEKRYKWSGLHPLEGEMAKDKKDIKKDILNMFRSLQDEDKDVLSPERLESEYFKRLNWDEKIHYQKAVNDLISKGLVKNVRGSSLNLKLTEKGADLINS
jgi:predicted transcriptional regulator